MNDYSTHQFFKKDFKALSRRYNSRNAYIRSCAVMSMVGFVLGLGDRHGENILFDSTTGECVHVDFNCLFNKGETFETPERVPFRLTRNMTEAFGMFELSIVTFLLFLSFPSSMLYFHSFIIIPITDHLKHDVTGV
jgi:phosphatidylinositol kinase/protein kinase (PI-3  family)